MITIQIQMLDPMEIKTLAYDTREKTVERQGNSGRVYLPRAWIGKKVRIFLVEPVTLEDNDG